VAQNQRLKINDQKSVAQNQWPEISGSKSMARNQWPEISVQDQQGWPQILDRCQNQA
jgi:hypothetical protein